MRIEQGNAWATVTHATPEEHAWLDGFLSCRGTARGGRVPLYNPFAQRFPAGLTHLVLAGAGEAGFTVALTDTRPAHTPPVIGWPALTPWLYDHQYAAVEACLTAGRGIVHSPTGSGKSEVAVALAQIIPCRWLFFAHRTELLYQFAERFKLRTGEECGLWGDGKFRDGRVVVASLPTAYAALAAQDPAAIARLDSVGGMHYDEVHTAASSTFFTVAQSTPNAYWRFGFSGTPFDRSDKRGLLVLSTTGPIVYRVATETLVDGGVVARPVVWRRPAPIAPVSGDSYGLVYERVATQLTRLTRTANIIQRDAEKPCVAFVHSLKHGEALVAELARRGLRARFVHGKHGTRERRAALDDLGSGALEVLVTNEIFQAGIDVPEIMSVVLAGGGKSPIAMLQSLGRGMRRRARDGRVIKDTFDVFDVVDTHCGCRAAGRYAHKSCAWFDRHGTSRLLTYRAAGIHVVEAGP